MSIFEINTKNLSFLTWIRATSAIMILVCHYVEQNSNAYIRMFAQFLNIGVHLFFILSGFLAGYRGIAKPYNRWFRKNEAHIHSILDVPDSFSPRAYGKRTECADHRLAASVFWSAGQFGRCMGCRANLVYFGPAAVLSDHTHSVCNNHPIF